MSILLFESLIDDPEHVVMGLQAELRLDLHKPARIDRVNTSESVEPVGEDVLARLRATLRHEAEAIARFVPEVEMLWPTLAQTR